MALSSYRRTSGQPKSLAELAMDAEQQARSRTLAREQEIRNIYGDMLNLYSPGGAMEKAGMQQIERAKVGSTTKTMQSDISRGLYGIRPYEQEWEVTTGMGARMTLEDILTRGRAAIMGQKASFVERIEDEYPDLGAVERGYAAMGSFPGGGGGGFGGGGASGTSPSTRPGWAIGYGKGPLERPAEGERQRADMTGGPVSGTGMGPGIGGATQTSGDTLHQLLAEGRAETGTSLTDIDRTALGMEKTSQPQMSYEQWFGSKPAEWQKENRLMAPGGPWVWMGKKTWKRETGQ